MKLFRDGVSGVLVFVLLQSSEKSYADLWSQFFEFLVVHDYWCVFGLISVCWCMYKLMKEEEEEVNDMVI